MTPTLTPRRRALVLLASVVLLPAIGAPAAAARTVTLHLFSRTTSSRYFDPKGHALAPDAKPGLGDTFDDTGIDYAGSHAHHSSKVSGSDHLRCAITFIGSISGPAGVCNGQIALGHAMLLANDEDAQLSSAPRVHINGGTGKYLHARGTITPTTVGGDTDFTIRVTY